MTRNIAFLVFDQFQILDATGPIAAFEMPMRAFSPSPYRITPIARRRGLVTSSSGVALQARSFGDAGAVDTLVVAGGDGTRQAMACPRTLDFIREQARTARRVCSVCSGSFILAAAGVLDGRVATTHWSRSRDFERLYPQVRLQPDRIHTRDGRFWTSAGVTAGIDLALALIGDDLGEPVAKRVAQELVVFHRRPGGQSQFSALLQIGQANGRFAQTLSWIREHLDEALTVERLAQMAHMSPRHFARAFAIELSMTPAKAVEQVRLEAARERIENSTTPIEQVAQATGFGDPERMRRAFVRAFGQPPQSLRRVARG